MPTLASINGASLTPDISGALNLALNTFGTPQSRAAAEAEAERQRMLQDALADLMGGPVGAAAGSELVAPTQNPPVDAPVGVEGVMPGMVETFPLEPTAAVSAGVPAGFPQGGRQRGSSPRAQEAALLRIAAIDPKMAGTMREVLARGDERELNAIQSETEKGTRLASYISSQEGFAGKRAAITEAAQAAAQRGEPVDRFIELMNMPEPQLDLALQRMQVMGTDLATLTKPPEQFTLSRGGARYDAQGNLIAERSNLLSPEEEAQKARIASAGKTDITVDARPTKGQTKFDETVANDLAAWGPGGGSSDAIKNIAQLEDVATALESGTNLTGPGMSLIPDVVMAFTNPEAITVREGAEEVAQRNLKAVLGSQFTEEEGKRLIKRVFNPDLEEAENVRRIRRLAKQMKLAAEAKNDAMQYFNANGTLKGWQGNIPTISDFNVTSDTGGVQPPSSGTISFGDLPE